MAIDDADYIAGSPIGSPSGRGELEPIFGTLHAAIVYTLFTSF